MFCGVGIGAAAFGFGAGPDAIGGTFAALGAATERGPTGIFGAEPGALGAFAMSAVFGRAFVGGGGPPTLGAATLGAPPIPPPAVSGFAMLGMSCVPGMRPSTGEGGPGLVDPGDATAGAAGEPAFAVCAAGGSGGPGCDDFGGSRIDGGTPCASASRCESTLLTASGDTCDGTGAGMREGGGCPGTTGGAGAVAPVGSASASGGGPYIESRRSFGIAVTPNGSTGFAGVDPTRGSATGVPHAEQNFRDPISSAPHFAQWVIA
jgi:hypothetical protein